MPISKSRMAAMQAQLIDPVQQKKIIEQIEEQRRDPFSFSDLRFWLTLDTWSTDEGLLLLSGLDPRSIEMGDIPGKPWEFRDALPLNQHHSFSFDPVDACSREEWKYSADSYESYLKAYERKSAILNGHRRVLETLTLILERSIAGLGERIDGFSDRYRPSQFLAWAKSISFVPIWLEWAEAQKLLPEIDSPFVAPFFDADAPEYPEYLAIAVRAWEHAKGAKGGTPKQRILSYLSERYPAPALSDAAREAIATVANWQRVGGRPKMGG